jgi:hypothetical protein
MPFNPKKYTMMAQAVSAVENSNYQEVWPFEDVTIHFFGLISGDIVKVQASNEDGNPANWVDFGTDITANDIVMLNELPEKIRIRVSNNSGGGTITAIMHARRPG